jgi:polar amino acid transport system substrate-binding protein
MRKALQALSAVALAAVSTSAPAESPLRFARIENIPDQFVGGEVLRAVYDRLELPIELVDLPAKRALVDSSGGKLDGEVHRNVHVQEQYPSLLIVRPAINYIEPSVFTKDRQVVVTGWSSLRGLRVGIVRGVGTSEDGTRGLKDVLAVTTLEQLMLALDADRIDVAISDAFSGLASLRRLGLESRIRVLTPPLQRTEIFHFLHVKHRALVPRVERALLPAPPGDR